MRSSQRFTAEGSTLATRAISSVSNLSQSFQPRRSASCAAMLAAPQPYSRSMVMSRNIATLVYRHSAARFGLFHQEDHGDHGENSHPEKLEAIDIRQHGRLP